MLGDNCFESLTFGGSWCFVEFGIFKLCSNCQIWYQLNDELCKADKVREFRVLWNKSTRSVLIGDNSLMTTFVNHWDWLSLDSFSSTVYTRWRAIQALIYLPLCNKHLYRLTVKYLFAYYLLKGGNRQCLIECLAKFSRALFNRICW